ncbi:hypothetical protein, partial [Methylobacterium haplocladii]
MSGSTHPTNPPATPATDDPTPAAGAPDTAAPTQAPEDELPDFDLDSVFSQVGSPPRDRRGPLARMRASRLPGLDLVVLVAAEAALPRALLKDLAAGRPVAVVITVPSAAWFRPLSHLIDRLSDRRASVVEAPARP